MTTAVAGSTRGIGRLVLGVCIVAGASMSVTASLNYVLTPMLDDLGVTREEASTALAIPSIAAILVVFLAGMLGDRLGQRKVLLGSSIVFVAGCALVGVANGLPLVSLGLLLEGIGATFLSVVALGLLSARISDDGQRASAFASYGLVSPIVYLTLPVLTGLIVRDSSWRLVPLIWAIIGIGSAIAVLALLPTSQRSEGSGELATPLLAGFVVAAGVQTLSHISASGLLSARVLLSFAACIIGLVALVIVYRRSASPTLSLGPLKGGATALLLIVVVLVPFANTWYYATLAFEYIFGLTVLATAIAMIPAQIGGMIGAKAVAGPLMRRIGVQRSGVLMLIGLAVGMASVLVVRIDSPVWVLCLCVAVFSLFSIGSGVVITNALMSTVPRSQSGSASAYKSAATALGVSLGYIIMGSIVFGAAQASMTNRFEAAGLTAEQAQQEITVLQQATQQPDYLSQYGYPIPDGESAADIAKQSLLDALHLNGVLGGAIALVCAGVYAGRRRLPTPTGA